MQLAARKLKGELTYASDPEVLTPETVALAGQVLAQVSARGPKATDELIKALGPDGDIIKEAAREWGFRHVGTQHQEGWLETVWNLLHAPDDLPQACAHDNKEWPWESADHWAAQALSSSWLNTQQRMVAAMLEKFGPLNEAEIPTLQKLKKLEVPVKLLEPEIARSLLAMGPAQRLSFAEQISEAKIFNQLQWIKLIAQHPKLGAESLWPQQRAALEGDELPPAALKVLAKHRHPLMKGGQPQLTPEASEEQIQRVAAEVFGLLAPSDGIKRVQIHEATSASTILKLLHAIREEAQERGIYEGFFDQRIGNARVNGDFIEGDPRGLLEHLLADERLWFEGGSRMDSSRCVREWQQLKQDLYTGAITSEQLNSALDKVEPHPCGGWMIINSPDKHVAQAARLHVALYPGVKFHQWLHLGEIDRDILSLVMHQGLSIEAAAQQVAEDE